jgi:hypothetical protein
MQPVIVSRENNAVKSKTYLPFFVVYSEEGHAMEERGNS